MPILDNVRARAKKAGRDGSIPELYMYFVDQCRTNLHMVIAMSPFGDAFRTRLRMFPSPLTGSVNGLKRPCGLLQPTLLLL
jgi:dynein heavy chain